MNNLEFQRVLEDQMDACRSMLSGKAAEYASDVDRLHNFKTAAALTPGETVSQALAGMMKKHTVSIYDMIASGEDYPLSVWDEKIGDHLNYLFLLKAIILEDKMVIHSQNAVSKETNIIDPDYRPN